MFKLFSFAGNPGDSSTPYVVFNNDSGSSSGATSTATNASGATTTSSLDDLIQGDPQGVTLLSDIIELNSTIDEEGSGGGGGGERNNSTPSLVAGGVRESGGPQTSTPTTPTPATPLTVTSVSPPYPRLRSGTEETETEDEETANRSSDALLMNQMTVSVDVEREQGEGVESTDIRL